MIELLEMLGKHWGFALLLYCCFNITITGFMGIFKK